MPYQQFVITDIAEPVPDFRVLTLEETGPPKLVYQAGQFITLVHHGSHEEVRRSYSMTSSPVLNEPLTIGVRRLENGSFSRLLFRFRKGNTLSVAGAGGFFTLPETIRPHQQFFFLAAGAGITPVFSLIKTLLALYPDTQVILLYSNHSQHEAVFMQQLLALAENYPLTFTVEFLFSTNADLSRARLNPELLYKLLKEYGADVQQGLFYICGPEAYMRMCLFTLREAGIQDDHIRRENFVTRKKELTYVRPPDDHRHNVTIQHKGSMVALSVQYPVSILETAKRAGIPLPYSCQSGVCGNCVARCISGTVWMVNNEVLTDSDLKEGLVLTCTGFPVAGEVLLRID